MVDTSCQPEKARSLTKSLIREPGSSLCKYPQPVQVESKEMVWVLCLLWWWVPCLQYKGGKQACPARLLLLSEFSRILVTEKSWKEDAVLWYRQIIISVFTNEGFTGMEPHWAGGSPVIVNVMALTLHGTMNSGPSWVRERRWHHWPVIWSGSPRPPYGAPGLHLCSCPWKVAHSQGQTAKEGDSLGGPCDPTKPHLDDKAIDTEARDSV